MPNTVVNATSINVGELTIGSGFYSETYAAAASARSSLPVDLKAGHTVSSQTYDSLAGAGGVAPVPEPGTLVLLALAGLGALLAWRRK